MRWLEIDIKTISSDDGMAVELVVAALAGAGVEAVQVLDDYEMRLHLENTADNWDYADDALLRAEKGIAVVRFYVAEEFSHDTITAVNLNISSLKNGEFGDNVGTLAISINNVDDEDWAENWKKYYKPFELGKKLIICPEWEEVPANNNKTVLKLNPGQVFGTGQHQTTAMCLEILEKYISGGETVADLGCGSGILGIAALLLGAQSVTAVDIDKTAEAIVFENAALNFVSDKITMFTGNLLADNILSGQISAHGGYEIVVANIVADIVMAMAPYVCTIINNGGKFISSGIIKDRLAEVLETLENNGFQILDIIYKDEWVSVISQMTKIL
ncbi:MAG: 50S ribosomal protein L11 methyltransferase [Defluviitaleaceae bacterium]|nr:50S ribosomal protein L11 methyltransferase [Defluviitaleaceae bacterium]